MKTNSQTDINELAGKVIKGVNKAVSELIKTSAAADKNLIIGNLDGTSRSVPAKELLKSLPE